jgi:nucleoside-diphosphate-sugar epimerase
MKVLVIGGAGYIGSTVSRELWQRGHDVTVLDLLLFGGESLVPLMDKPRFKLVQGDLRDEATLAEVLPGHDAVCLLAAIVGEPACNRDPQAAVETNLHGGRKVLSAAKHAGVKRFVFASTCSNYGISDSNSLATEETPLQPLSTYSETKVAVERDVLAAANGEFHPTVLRFSTAFGVSARMRFDLLVIDFTLAAFRDRKVVIYGEQFWRPYVHVRDAARAIGMVLEAPAEKVRDQVFNVGDNGENFQKGQLVDLIQNHIKDQLEIKYVQKEEDPRDYRVSFDKISSQLGYAITQTVDDGIRQLIEAIDLGVVTDCDSPRYRN